MKITQRGGVLAGLLAAAIAMPVAAEDYPNKDLQYIVPFGPGGEVDISARLQQPLFQEVTGQQMIVSYKPGGGGAVAWSQMNDMPADGYTAVAFSLPHIILKPIAGNVGFQTEDVSVVHVFHYSPDAIVVRKDSPFKTLEDLLEAARAQPGAVTFSGTGTYTANHVAQKRFDTLAGITTTYIPFKGTAAAVTGLLNRSARAQWGYTTVAAAHSDEVRMLAVALEERHPLFPDVPTFKEKGIDMIGGAYRGVAVPRDTPEEIKGALSDVFQKINDDPEFRQDMENLGFAILDVEYDEVDEFMAKRRAEYEAVAKDFGLMD
jgi:tripartite-type tricarboxylate transporter receptor subunit TctC